MAPQPTVGLVGSRTIDEGLQSSDKKTVVDFAFPANSRTPNQISIPKEGAYPNKNPKKLGDSYADGVEDTNLCATTKVASRAACASPRHTLLTPPRSRLPGSQGQDLLRRAHRDVRHVHAAVRAVSGRLCGGHRHWEALDHAAASVPAALPNFILSRSLFHWIQAWFFLLFLCVRRGTRCGCRS